jgi:iron complex outermembrane receptor protein
MDASIGYLDAQYDDFPACPAPVAASAAEIRENCAGNRIVLAPEWTGALGVEWTIPAPALGGDWVVRSDWRYQSEVFFEPQNMRRLGGDARNVVNLRAGVRTGAWDFFVWAENAGDETYVAFADDRSAIAVPLTRAYGAPRTYGATLRLRH